MDEKNSFFYYIVFLWFRRCLNCWCFFKSSVMHACNTTYTGTRYIIYLMVLHDNLLKKERNIQIYSINLSLNTFCGSTEHFTFHYGTKAIQHLKSSTFFLNILFFLNICSHNVIISIMSKWASGSSHKWVCKIFQKHLPKLQILVACKIKYLLLTAKVLLTIQLHEWAW